VSDPLTTSSGPTNGTYNPRAFYPMSRDKTAPYAQSTAYIGIPAHVRNLMGELVASRKVPELTTVSAVVRNAIYHGLHHMKEVVDDPTWAPIATAYQAEVIGQARLAKLEAEKKLVDTVAAMWQGAESPGQRAEVLRDSLDMRQKVSYDPYLAQKIDDLIARYNR
jgi:hypothetical protein